MNRGGTLVFYIGSRVRGTKLEGLSSLNLRGTLRVVVREGLDLEPGDEFALWDADRTTLASEPALELAAPGQGLAWDTSGLEQGILRVVEGMGVASVEADAEVECEVYALDGAWVGRIICRYGDLDSHLHQSGLAPGIYNVKISCGNVVMVRKTTLD